MITGPIRVMSLVWYKVLPAAFGGQKVIATFNEAIGNHFALYCVCSNNNKPGSHSYQVFNFMPNSKWQFVHPWIWLKIYRFAAQHKITHVVLEHPYHGIAGWLLKLSGKFIITHAHNIEFQRFRQQQSWFWPLLYCYEKWVLSFSHLVLFTTKEDATFANSHLGVRLANSLILPYPVMKMAIDKQEARAILAKRYNLPADTSILLFNGTLDYLPNARAVENIYSNLLPLLLNTSLNFVIIITGRLEISGYQYLLKLKHDKVIMAGYVQNVDLHFAGADVYINTVSSGGGVQTKTLEALSYNLPVVCFNHMLAGIEQAVTGNKILAVPANNWQAFANAIGKASVNHETIPDAFYNHYNMQCGIKPLTQRIENQNL